jgi:D-psicose/D-tagatose/L-ribulose 3-epimerase
MDYGVNTWVWEAGLTTKKIEDLVPKVAGMGFDVIELPIAEVDAVDFERVDELLDQFELDATLCAVFGPDRDFIHPDDPEKRTNAINYVRGCVEGAGTLGADRLGGPMYSAVGRVWQSTEAQREEHLEQLTGDLRGLSKFADKHGVTLCIEPINRYETSFLNTVEQTLELVERVDHPACGILLDTFHLNIEEQSIPGAIRKAGDQLAHLHTCGNDRGAPGDGHIPWNEVGEALADIDYDGRAVIESFTPEVESIARAASIWRSFAPDQDHIAKKGLETLQKHL